ncbi:MAG: sensor histidine kinase [Verrucomicrobiales bacterium]|nr:sensor histidine kinase [Verrucomicrobiales bacterium]
MWPLLTVIWFAIAASVYFYFRKRLRESDAKHANELSSLREQHRGVVEKIEAQQKTLLNSMAEGLLVLDERGAIQVTNRALEEFFDFTGSLNGKSVLEAFRLHELAAVIEQLEIEPQVLEHEIEVPGLRSRWLQLNAATIRGERGERLGAVLVFHDVTRIKALEETRREFVANVSHELRTPLSMIKGFSETLLTGAMHDPDVSTRFLQGIDKHAVRLARLIDDLLTISQLESGRVILNLHTVNIRGIVDAVFEDLRERAVAQQMHLKNEIDSSVVLSADPDRIKQVFWNLIENAIKYGKPNGQVTVSAKPSGEDLVEVEVRDDGRGIPADALPRIFERFYRVDKARSREAGGTGLGLAIVKHIVQSHGGKVRAESTMGAGTAFFFTLFHDTALQP